MPSPYNLTGMNNTNFMEKIIVLNNGVENLLSLAILLIILCVLFFSMKDYPMKQSASASLFITTLIAVFMFAGGIIPLFWVTILITLTGISGIILMFNN